MVGWLLKRKRKRDAAIEYPDYFWTMDSGHEPVSNAVTFDEHMAELRVNIDTMQAAAFAKIVALMGISAEQAADSVASLFAVLEMDDVWPDSESAIKRTAWQRSRADVAAKRGRSLVAQRRPGGRRMMMSRRYQLRRYARSRR